MLKIAQNKSVSAPPRADASAPACQREHKNRIRTTCQDCGLFIPGAPYSPDEVVKYFGGPLLYIGRGTRTASDPSPADVACPRTEADIAADDAAEAAEGNVKAAREALFAAEAVLTRAQGRREWGTGPSRDEERAAAALPAAHEAYLQADAAALQAFVRRNRQQQIRGARMQTWRNAHPTEW